LFVIPEGNLRLARSTQTIPGGESHLISQIDEIHIKSPQIPEPARPRDRRLQNVSPLPMSDSAFYGAHRDLRMNSF
jgi:hypothetical protein